MGAQPLSNMQSFLALCILCSVLRVQGHGSLSTPAPRNAPSNPTQLAGTCSGESCWWLQEGCQAGCGTCAGDKCYSLIAAGAHSKCCKDVTEPTLTDPQYLTYPMQAMHKISKYNPWFSPGAAPVANSCGLMGGGSHCMGGVGTTCPKMPHPFGTLGTDLPAVQDKTTWAPGSVQDVSWNIVANHGGGYAYRLCPMGNVSEDCFQQHHLEFVGNQSWIQYSDDKSNRTAIPAVRVSQGTTPKGSTWTRNPIPACSGGPGGAMSLPGCATPQFKPPMDVDGPWTSPGHPQYTKGTPGIFGFGPGRCYQTAFNISTRGFCRDQELKYWQAKFNFNIIDQVQVPSDLPAGDYLLSWRWDAEQTPQVWTNCADVSIRIK